MKLYIVQYTETDIRIGCKNLLVALWQVNEDMTLSWHQWSILWLHVFCHIPLVLSELVLKNNYGDSSITDFALGKKL